MTRRPFPLAVAERCRALATWCETQETATLPVVPTPDVATTLCQAAADACVALLTVERCDPDALPRARALRVRRWTPETVPEPGRRVAVYFTDGRISVAPMRYGSTVECAAAWNRFGDITHWHDAPDAERAP